VGLILAGAVPASMLALAVQALFELGALLLVPRGQRAPNRVLRKAGGGIDRRSGL
jgi:ABC-type proline/glycine betaine transport system permease subunit